jgi:hypothetical protein
VQSFGTLPLRIQTKIQLPDNPNDCWPWIACVSPAGYGRVGWERSVRESHRIVYTLLVEPIPDGMVLDHMCHHPQVCHGRNRECPHRRCQNPAHMTPVTRGVNALRSWSPPALNALSDRCDNGHLYVEGSYRIEDGHRRCLICRRENDRQRRPRGVGREGVGKGLRAYRPVGTPEIAARNTEIVRLRGTGLSAKTIAAELGLSKGCVSAVIWRYDQAS